MGVQKSSIRLSLKLFKITSSPTPLVSPMDMPNLMALLIKL